MPEDQAPPNRSEGSEQPMPDNKTAHHQELVAEIWAMVRYARHLNRTGLTEIIEQMGEDRNQDTVPDWETFSNQALYRLHQDLTKFVAPATPPGIRRVEPSFDGKDRWRFLGPVPVVRWLIMVAVLSLVAAAALFAVEPQFIKSGFDEVDATTTITNKDTVNDLYAVLFVITAASLGSSFYALMTAFRFVNNRSFDSVRNSTYLARFILGLVSGLVLTIVLFGTGFGNGIGSLGLAILGGFSSDIVFRILTRMVRTIEYMVLGDREPDPRET